MPDKSIIIIGGGIAGLAAGCYAQMNGYRTQIFELHFLPGGLCTAWERGPYVFDGCIHYLFGSGPGQPFHDVWEELGAVQGRDFVLPDDVKRLAIPTLVHRLIVRPESALRGYTAKRILGDLLDATPLHIGALE